MSTRPRFPVARGVTAAAVALLAACGGSGGGGALPALASLWPLATTPEGMRYTYDIVKVVTRGGVAGAPKNRELEFRVDHSGGLDLIQSFDGLDMSGAPLTDDIAGFAWSHRGLEAVMLAGQDFNSLGGPCVTAATPGLLVAPADFSPGDTHVCSVPTWVDTASLTWVGPEAVPGYPARTASTSRPARTTRRATRRTRASVRRAARCSVRSSSRPA